MADWPPAPFSYGARGVYSSFGRGSGVADVMLNVTAGAAVWPAANRALYLPFYVGQAVVAYKMAFNVAATAGNYDVGIYDENAVRLVSVGSTAVPAVGLAVADIADTPLTPGTYFMAMVVSTNTTFTTTRLLGSANVALTTSGMQQQDLGSTVLPASATFARIGSSVVPLLAVATKATI